MFENLSAFYHSRKWRTFLDELKQERVNEEGDLICNYCGRPIVKAYDIIGHHKIELTEENVNDYTISLNPENVEFVHHKCHNLIHNKLGYKKREVFLVYGAPLAGKSDWVRENKSTGDLVINIDDIWCCVSGCKRYVKPNRLKSVVFKVRDTLIESVKYRYGKWNNAYIVGGYPLQSERERLCKELGAREVFINCTEQECFERLEKMDDLEEKDEFKNFISSWFEKFSPPLSS